MNGQRTLRLAILGIILGTAFGAPLYSQTPATTLQELVSNQALRENETLEITETNGTKYRAKLTSISGRRITVRSQSREFTLNEAQVREIRHARPDSLLNGTLIGLGAGFGAGMVAVTSTCSSNDSECSVPASLVFIPVFAAGGAGIGALIDSLIQKQETIFSRSTASKMHINPIVGKKTAGVQFSLRF